MYRFEKFYASAVILMWLVLSIPATAAANNFYGSVALATGGAFRGIEQVQSGFAYSAYLEHSWSNGFFLGVWGGRTSMRSHPVGKRELNYTAGYRFSPSSKIQVRTALVHYRYLNSTGYRNYDWNEWLTSVYLNSNWILSYGLGKNWFAEDELSHYGEISRLMALPGRVVFDLSLGAVQLENVYLDNYQYLEAGLSRSFGSFLLRGMLSITDSDARAFLGDRAAGRQTSIALRWTF